MRRSYYISNGKEQEGPFALYELEEKAVTSSTLIWYEGLENWKPATEIPEIAELLKEKVSPPPVPQHSATSSVTPPALTITPQPEEESNSSIWKRVLYATAACAVLFLGYLFYMNTVYYPQVQAEAQAAEQVRIAKIEQLRIEEEERKAEERRKYIRNNFSSFLNVTNTPYTSYYFGGIEGLYITIDNSSEYRFDRVVVKVAYIKDGGGIYKYEDIDFGKIKAKGSKTMKAPNSDRGTRVNYDITYASSERLNFEYEYNAYAEGDDPYRMK